MMQMRHSMKNTRLYTERLVLRLIRVADLNDIHTLHSLPETNEFNTLGIPKSILETQGIVERWISDHQQQSIRNYTFAIELIPGREFVGLIALRLAHSKFRSGEVWYKLHPDYWRKGYATEALNRLLDFGFSELHLHRIEAGCAVANIGSIKVLEKVGMLREGRKRQVLPLKTGWSDTYEYAILASDTGK